MSESQYNYLFVSDFHIASGLDPVEKTYHPREDFYYDREFLRFLLWADAHRESDGAAWELVFDGDCFDFLPIQTTLYDYQKFVFAKQYQKTKDGWGEDFFAGVETFDSGDADLGGEAAFEDYGTVLEEEDFFEGIDEDMPGFGAAYREDAGLDSWLSAETIDPALDPIKNWTNRNGFLPTPGISVSRLELIFRGHPCFLQALAWWVSRGHRLVFLAGNHDLELNWSQVRSELRILIYEAYSEFLGGGYGTPCVELPTAAIQGIPSDLKEEIFQERIDFHSWFYLKKGIFYAEHGNQYEMGNSVSNMLRPWLETNAKVATQTGPNSANLIPLTVMNHPLGSVIVESLVGPLEDKYPQWENVGSLSQFLVDIFRKDPLYMLDLIFVRSGEFWTKLRSLWELTKDHPGEHEFPTDAELEEYATIQGLPGYLGRVLYSAWSRPLLSYPWLRKRLFGPERILFWLIVWLLLTLLTAAGLWLWFGVLSPALTTLLAKTALPSAIGDQALSDLILNNLNFLLAVVGFLGTYQLLKNLAGKLGTTLLWLASAFAREDLQRIIDRYILPRDYIRKGAERIHAILSENLRPEDVPYFYIMGHDHHPNFRIIERMPVDAFQSPRIGNTCYVNTGSWLPSFSDTDLRRLRTGGLDSEFTFFKVVRVDMGAESYYAPELLRWNDFAERAEPQVIPSDKVDKERDKEILQRIVAGDETPLDWDPQEILTNYRVQPATTRLYEQLARGLEKIKGTTCETFSRAWDGEWRVAYTLWNGRRLCTVSLKRPDRLPKLIRAIRKHGWVRGWGKATERDPMRVTIPIADGLGEAIEKSDEISDVTRDVIVQELERGNAFATLAVADDQVAHDLLTAFGIIERETATGGWSPDLGRP